MEHLRLEGGCFRTAAGKPVYLIGANFWPSRTGPFMYREPWDSAAVGKDLDELAALGANCVRIFCFWPDFMPAENAVAAQALERLEQTVALCAARGMWSVPTLFVGHMSGENWHPPWARGRDYYCDERLLAAQELFIRAVGARYKEDPRLAAWLLTNEWPLFAGRVADARGIGWARRMSAALRAVDPSHPLSLGDGAWDIVWGQSTGLPARELSSVIDFFGPHFYPKESDSLRHSLVASFAMRMAEPLGKPVLLEEFGCSSDQADDGSAADYYRTTLWSAFGAGNCGALAWNSHDFDALATRRPYSHHPYEMHFGLLRRGGVRKPQADEFARFAAFAARHDPNEWQAEKPAVAIGRTSYFLESFPFDWGWTKREQRDLHLQTYALCVRAGFAARFVDLGEPIDAELLIVPCLQALTTKDAANLEAFAHGGGVVYASYGGEPWHPALERFIGAKPRIRYGLVEPAPPRTIALRGTEQTGGLRHDERIPIRVRGEERRTSMLLCEPVEAGVLAVDEQDRPALFKRTTGSGAVVFCAYPLEYYLLHGLDPNAGDETWRVYRAAGASLAGAPFVERRGLVQHFAWQSRADGGRRRYLLVNHAWEPSDVAFAPGAAFSDAENGSELRDGCRLPAKGVRVLDVKVTA